MVDIRSGLFRACVLIAALWVTVLGALAFEFVPEMYRSGHYWYVLDFRSDVDASHIDWKKPLYDLIVSPSKEKLTPVFSDLGSNLSDEWDKGVKDSSLKVFQDTDDGKLYLKGGLNAQDIAYVEKAFVASKWKRHMKILSYWAALIAGPPIAIFALGEALLWVLTGFASEMAWKR